MTANDHDTSIVRYRSQEEIRVAKVTYESWHPLHASPRTYAESPLAFRWGYEAIGPRGAPVGLMGVVYTDEAFANVGGAVDPKVRGRGIGRSLLEALLSELPRELTVVVEPVDPRTSAPALLADLGFRCEDAGRVETFLHDLGSTRGGSGAPAGYSLSTVFEAAPEDLDAVVDLERTWCVERDQPVGPRLISDYAGPEEGFVVLARDRGGRVVGLANAELANVDGLGLAALFVVDPAHRGRGVGRVLKEAQLESARRFGWKELLVTVPEADHPAARLNAGLGGLGLDGLKWVRPAGS